jgi:hypothetical protein
MRLIQIVPKKQFNLYGALVAKEFELRTKKQGTFRRAGTKEKGYAKWEHRDYPGWLWLHPGSGKVVTVKLQCRAEDDSEWKLLHGFIGFLDRNFADKILSINIQYE